LTNVEYEASVRALFGADATVPVASFPRDSTQKLGFTLNDAQIVSSVLASQLDAAALGVVAAARQNGRLANLSPCTSPTTQGETCARTFIGSFAQKAYRRPLTAEDTDPLVALYRAGVEGGTYADGIDLVTRAVLQSPGFLYITELGSGTGAGESVSLTPHETASVLSYMITAGPPDQALLDGVGDLATAAGREQQMRRLLASAPARERLVRVVREWLGIDGVVEQSKADPAFAGYKNAMLAETAGFIGEVMQNGGATVAELLGAEWTAIASGAGATSQEISTYFTAYYGLASGAPGRNMLTAARGGSRIGILNQGAFLATFATFTDSHPIRRGVAVMRRLACISVPDPVELNINVVPPVPDPAHPQTTRQLYTVHAADAQCRPCHITPGNIDNFGFAFEHYDAMGGYRQIENVEAPNDTRMMLPIDSKTTVSGTGTDLDGTYDDSNALARALARSSAVRACMARQLFRASAGRSDGSVTGSEDAFVGQWRQLSAEQQASVIETLAAFVRSNIFVERRTVP
jgi:hypothetical protein